MKLIIKVKRIKGKCPVYKEGDKIVIDEGYRLNLKETDAVCLHSLASIMPYYIPLSKGVDPKEMGLVGEGDNAYLQCLDPCEYTGGGTVIFELIRTQQHNNLVTE
ncbi:TIGR04076 family protein [candidate division WOR-3 bacterium]|nr:TIGR04076 family protein [candidate division WOR-3 bacterium]